MRNFSRGLIGVVLLTLAGCETRSLEADMDAYCECMSNYETMVDFKECIRKMDEIVQHYEYDPEAPEYIQERIKECGITE